MKILVYNQSKSESITLQQTSDYTTWSPTESGEYYYYHIYSSNNLNSIEVLDFPIDQSDLYINHTYTFNIVDINDEGNILFNTHNLLDRDNDITKRFIQVYKGDILDFVHESNFDIKQDDSVILSSTDKILRFDTSEYNIGNTTYNQINL